ncbi:unnamed protein product [Paramecium octaurelia]|uniref:Uncharacterized protein n=1 Tax=Paramecium octaurelia TaxID=43137 RepID=A0A8S1WRP7_PAROT|nr:unnamed protein product [Paramecium octaurelia]
MKLKVFFLILKQKGLTIGFDLNLSERTIFADQRRLKQIFITLDSNVQKFTFKDDIRLIYLLTQQTNMSNSKLLTQELDSHHLNQNLLKKQLDFALEVYFQYYPFTFITQIIATLSVNKIVLYKFFVQFYFKMNNKFLFVQIRTDVKYYLNLNPFSKDIFSLLYIIQSLKVRHPQHLF